MKPIGRREFLKGTGVGLAALLAAPDLAFSKIGPWRSPAGIPLQGMGGSLPERVDLGPGPVRNSQRGVRGQMLLEGLLQGRNSAPGGTGGKPIPSTPVTRPASTLGNAMERIAGSISGMVTAGSSPSYFAPGLPERDHLLRLHEAGKLPQVPAQENWASAGKEVGRRNPLGEGL